VSATTQVELRSGRVQTPARHPEMSSGCSDPALPRTRARQILLLAMSLKCNLNPRLVPKNGRFRYSASRAKRRRFARSSTWASNLAPASRFPALNAAALPATLYGRSTQAIYQNRPIE